MCLIIFDWRPDAQAAGAARFTLAANRDEFFSRAATPMDWWQDAPQVLAGRDLQGGGSWLGLHRDGRFAALTNYRAPAEMQLGGPSRGRLVADFLTGPGLAPLAYLQQLALSTDYGRGAQAHADASITPGVGPTVGSNPKPDAMPSSMRGFNLLVGDLIKGELAYYSNRANAPPRLLPAGCYGLSNALLDSDWPKVKAKKSALQDILDQGEPESAVTVGSATAVRSGAIADSCRLDALLAMMHDTCEAPDSALPDTGLTLERERALSAAYIVSPDYGTRCTTVLQLSRSGRIDIVERGDSQADGSRAIPDGHLSRYSFQLGTPSSD